MNQELKNKKLKNSDSDYKAEDEGSASDNASWRKYKKASFNFKPTKKQLIQNSIKTLVPIGVNLKYQCKLSNEQYNELLNVTSAKEYSFKYKCLLAKILQVIDGQHFKTVILYDGKPIKIVLRLNGISIPQIRKSQTKQFGTHIKKILKAMLQNKIVRVETGQYDKSGSIFSRVYVYTASPIGPFQTQAHTKSCEQFCINDYLIQHDMAKAPSKGKNEFNKKSYEHFCDKYQTKEWPEAIDYPLQMLKEPTITDYDEKEQQDDE